MKVIKLHVACCGYCDQPLQIGKVDEGGFVIGCAKCKMLEPIEEFYHRKDSIGLGNPLKDVVGRVKEILEASAPARPKSGRASRSRKKSSK